MSDSHNFLENGLVCRWYAVRQLTKDKPKRRGGQHHVWSRSILQLVINWHIGDVSSIATFIKIGIFRLLTPGQET